MSAQGSVPARVEVHDSAAALASAVAGELLVRLADAQARGREPRIVLTGGTIADAVHREIARLTSTAEVDWSRVEIWWGDERFVAPDSEDRNAAQARAAFLAMVGVDPARVREMPSTSEAADVSAAADAYAATLASLGEEEFDVTMLGVGPDAHVASLFPGYPQLDVEDRLVVPVTDSPKPPPERISLTFPALNRSRAVWFLVSGAEKAPAVARALSVDADPHHTPAAAVRGSSETTWFLDRAAASHL